MKEVHDAVKKTIMENTAHTKKKVDERKRDVQFQVGDLVMVHLNKERMQKGVLSKLQMRKIGPCAILEKYGSNAYKIDLPTNMGLSPIFNVADLVSYKGPILEGRDLSATVEDLKALKLLVTSKPKVEKILNSRVAKRTRTKTYMEYLVKWQG